MTVATAPRVAPARTVSRTSTPWLWLAIAMAVLVVAVALSIAVGARDIALSTVWNALTAFDPANAEHALVRDGRMTRTFIGVVAGGCLALAGSLAQAITRNPLADPGLLGINAGAAFAVVLGLTVVSVTGFMGQVVLAFIGAAVAAAVVMAIGGKGVASPLRLALAGAAITASLGAITSGLLMLNPYALGQFRFWLAGSLVGRSSVPWVPVVIVALAAAVVCVLNVRSMSALALGDDTAQSLGVKPWRTRAIVMAAVAVLAGLATALAGPIVFVGLAVPHLVRSLTGPRIGWQLALSAPVGAFVVVACDVVGRIVARPGEIAVGVMTALLGGLVLAVLVRRLKVAGL